MPYPGGTIETRSYYNTAPGTPLASVFLQPGGVNAVELVATFTLDAAGGESRLSLGSGGGAVSSTGGYWAGVELQSIDSDIPNPTSPTPTTLALSPQRRMAAVSRVSRRRPATIWISR